ncbi:unnamed protein product [Pleuronectes platessa]|uniref:Uncharacterized protein n=1 Tax=Pleuronectes platessa TaxID=8262 RepID=A0A9N7W442_PLEPL|nr:unnamed protein product [Pleuronectes platessa]
MCDSEQGNSSLEGVGMWECVGRRRQRRQSDPGASSQVNWLERNARSEAKGGRRDLGAVGQATGRRQAPGGRRQKDMSGAGRGRKRQGKAKARAPPGRGETGKHGITKPDAGEGSTAGGTRGEWGKGEEEEEEA